MLKIKSTEILCLHKIELKRMEPRCTLKLNSKMVRNLKITSSAANLNKPHTFVKRRDS